MIFQPSIRHSAIASAVVLCATFQFIAVRDGVATSAATKTYAVDFTQQADGDATAWLKSNGFDLKLSASSLSPRFANRQLVLETDGRKAGLFAREFKGGVAAKNIRITWGVDRYPQGADWNAGVYRVPIAVNVSFGEDKVDSGAIYVPDAPYFISLFLGEKEEAGRVYTARYYTEGGRYFCEPCNVPESEVVTTEFDLERAFLAEFKDTSMPAVSSLSFQMNTKDTHGGAHAFIRKIELY